MKTLHTFPTVIALLCCLPRLVGAFAALAEPDEALRWLLEARGMARAGRTFEALGKLHASVKLADQTGQHLAAALALTNLAEIYRLYRDTDKALSYYQQALEKYQAGGNQNGVDATRKKIGELTGPTDQEIVEPDREQLITRAIERVKNRLKVQQKSQERSGEAEYATYLDGVKTAVVRAWSYPELAIRSGKEGKVEVEFTILADGKLQAVRIAQSSENPSMDRAAIDAVKSAAPFSKIPEQLGLDRLEVEFTFNYVLQ